MRIYGKISLLIEIWILQSKSCFISAKYEMFRVNFKTLLAVFLKSVRQKLDIVPEKSYIVLVRPHTSCVPTNFIQYHTF